MSVLSMTKSYSSESANSATMIKRGSGILLKSELVTQIHWKDAKSSIESLCKLNYDLENKSAVMARLRDTWQKSISGI